jgi:hypothetical protein
MISQFKSRNEYRLDEHYDLLDSFYEQLDSNIDYLYHCL